MQAIEAVLVTRDSEAGRGGPVAITDPFAPLADLGYAICHVPLTRTAAPSDPGPLDDAVRHLSEFSWIAFTSARAVQGFANAVAGSGTFGSAGTRASVRFACVGPATARACESVLGRSADLVARSANAAGLARRHRLR